MKKSFTILVSGASGIVGYGILKCLRASGLPLELIGTTIYTDSAAEAFCDIFELAPRTNAPDYLRWLTGCIARRHVDMIIPSIEADMLFWNLHREELREAGTFPLLNRLELIEACRDKWLFYKQLEAGAPRYAIPTGISGSFEEISARYGVPFILKPRRGFGSQGIHLVRDAEEFGKYFSAAEADSMMLQPVIGSADEEFTVSAFFDEKSRCRAFQQLRRKLSPLGYTESADSCDLPGIREALEDLARVFSPVGPTNFQFRAERGQLKLLEINPRISSSSSMRCKLGYNEAEMAVRHFLMHQEISQPEIRRGRVVRYVDECYFPESESPGHATVL